VDPINAMRRGYSFIKADINREDSSLRKKHLAKDFYSCP
jgi:hypothetical protein